jgi:glucose-6-phosphate 1-dehydrogenase
MDAYRSAPLSVVVVGASGDLAARKIYPALFALYCQGFLPDAFRIVGFARSRLDDAAFRKRIAEHLTCRYVPGESCAARMEEFLARCTYVSGRYASRESFLNLYQHLARVPHVKEENRLYYLAIPPSVFVDVARAIGGAGLVACDGTGPWTRVVVEKPFGRDAASSAALTRELSQVFTEDQTYRIDHYLGKEVIQNLLVLRFANLVFEPVWNRQHIRDVRITWEENIGVEGRGGYFDHYGIIRDVMQNHLLQILALTAMEPPGHFDGKHIRDEKVQVLRNIPALALDHLVVGQYTGAERAGKRIAGYTEDANVPDGSRTPTFAAAVLRVHNRRWDGVPFYIRAGKALGERMTEIRIRFQDVPGRMFERLGCAPEANALVIRVQPDEAINLRIVNKVPGVGMALGVGNLDLQYKSAFEELIPDAYEDLLLDVMQGEKSLFIRRDELEAAWDIFTPALHALDARAVQPEPYVFGSNGPDAAQALAERHGFRGEG